jgi:hypothetical protein
MTFLGPALNLDAYPTIRRLFQNTSFGRAFIRGFLALGQSDVISRGRFNDHEETKKLIPPSSSFWSGTLVGMLNYPTDFFGLIRQGLVHVHIADIEFLSENTVHLSDGKDIEADLLICATGWKMTPTISFLPSKISDKTGISVATPSDPTVQAADAEIMKRWPLLKDQPPGGPNALGPLPWISSSGVSPITQLGILWDGSHSPRHADSSDAGVVDYCLFRWQAQYYPTERGRSILGRNVAE